MVATLIRWLALSAGFFLLGMSAAQAGLYHIYRFTNRTNAPDYLPLYGPYTFPPDPYTMPAYKPAIFATKVGFYFPAYQIQPATYAFDFGTGIYRDFYGNIVGSSFLDIGYPSQNFQAGYTQTPARHTTAGLFFGLTGSPGKNALDPANDHLVLATSFAFHTAAVGKDFSTLFANDGITEAALVEDIIYDYECSAVSSTCMDSLAHDDQILACIPFAYVNRA